MYLPPLLPFPMAPRACAAPGSRVLPPRVPSGCAAVQESPSGRKALGKKLFFSGELPFGYCQPLSVPFTVIASPLGVSWSQQMLLLHTCLVGGLVLN